MYTIHGEKEIDEIELHHLAGHKDSKYVLPMSLILPTDTYLQGLYGASTDIESMVRD